MIQEGKLFGRWKTLKYEYRNRRGWICECQCEKKTTRWVRETALKSGQSKSCGCLQREWVTAHNTTHGKSKTIEYKAYDTMMKRCYDPRDSAYDHYGGRKGNPITVCERWHDRMNFVNDAVLLPGYSENMQGMTLDRIDPDKGYFPENCRWATRVEQQNHRSNTIMVEFQGETIALANLARQEDIPHKRLASTYYYHKDKLSMEEIVSIAKAEKHRTGIPELVKEYGLPYEKLYHLIITRGMDKDTAVNMLLSESA